MHMFDVAAIKQQFPIFDHHPDLVYLDNAATTQKPRAVLDAERFYYEHHNANVHRGAHRLAVAATDAFEGARATVARFINAATSDEIIFTRGTTEAINLIANTFGESLLAGDEIIVSTLEHHANIVPWQMLAQRTGVIVRQLNITPDGEIDMEHLHELLQSSRARLLAISHASNAIGSIQDIQSICDLSHQKQCKVLVDGAQAIAHLPVDVQALGCDFYVFSGHKAYGPTGIGVAYIEQSLLRDLPPWQGGGEMIDVVSFAGTTYAAAPQRLEAGTPAIAQAVGLGAALDWLATLDRSALLQHETQLHHQLKQGLESIEGIKIHGHAKNTVSLSSMTFAGAHPYDVAQFLDNKGIAVRVGHHCAQPLILTMGIQGTLRASLAIYNTQHDVALLLSTLAETLDLL
ncbi:cysteine desulfurase [Chitinibacter bivalviorum]|uniref:Cysteine desulfurase n=1 Tax=Chitinibacter bivalviorum TaxID=2739434 RepID=A0A7H9BH29_9NEIS|nr:cysteine desulfurase [Chitinibacter bivalviorum]QLG87849.1 cysteine desulfurase [Chitinibacter bivalviorum]